MRESEGGGGKGLVLNKCTPTRNEEEPQGSWAWKKGRRLSALREYYLLGLIINLLKITIQNLRNFE